MKIQDIKTRFTKGDISETGSLCDIRKKQGKVIFLSQHQSTENGKLELIKKDDVTDGATEKPLLLSEEATEIHEYELDSTDEVFTKLQDLGIDPKDILLDQVLNVDEQKEKQEAADLPPAKRILTGIERMLRNPEKLIKFSEEYTGDKVTKPQLKFAQMDYDLVHRETIDIKTCRTNIFIVMLSVIGAIGVSLLGMHSRTDFGKWLLPASLVPLLLLTVAILSTIHKARGLNKRLGYLEALGLYIYHGEIPNCWSGWLNAIRISEKCKCQAEKSEGNPESCQGGGHCGKMAKDRSLKLSKYVHWKPNLLNSFTSFSTHCYMTAYIITVVSCVYALAHTICMFSSLTWVDLLAPGGAATIGGGMTISILLILRKIKKDSVIRIIAAFIVVITPVILVGLARTEQRSLPIIFAYIIGAASFSLACIGADALYHHVYAIGLGRYSIERFHRLWEYRFEKCPLMVQ